jgi:hypothetical protein
MKNSGHRACLGDDLTTLAKRLMLSIRYSRRSPIVFGGSSETVVGMELMTEKEGWR